MMKNRIKELREKKNVSQGDVAKALNVTPQAINQYETGMHEPKLETWDRLAIYFNVPVAYLQGYTVYLYGNNKKYEYCPYCMNKCFETDRAITKSWIEKRIHEKAVNRYENEINQAYNDLKDSVLGELSIKNPPEYCQHPLKSLNEDYCDSKEKQFSAIFKDYDEFKQKLIKKYEQEETDAVLHSITSISDFLDDADNN